MANARTNSKSAKILLIDDDVDFLSSTRDVLESKNYNVFTANEGDEGLKKARELKPDLIILDVIMPAKNGIAVCDQIKKDPQLGKIPVIMLTSLGQRMADTNISRADAMTLEAEDYVEKPVKPTELLKRVSRFLPGRS